MEYRKKTQPLTLPNVGSTFKNPSSLHAATLIEKAGLLHARRGAMRVSEKHPNFIINDGNGSAKEAWHLIHLLQEKVRHRFNVVLEPEVLAFCDEENS